MVSEFTCPIGGETFKQNQTSSGFQAGAMLDFKPYGAIHAPWPLPTCPINGFVMFKNNFTSEELELLKPLIEESIYKQSSQHFRAFLMMQKLNAPLQQQFNMLLQAVWGGGLLYIPKAHELVSSLLANQTLDEKRKVNFNLLKIEFERRQSKFVEAQNSLNELEGKHPDVLKTPIFGCQKQLIEQKNPNPSPIPNQHYKCGGFSPAG
jgi:hypothetical protein